MSLKTLWVFFPLATIKLRRMGGISLPLRFFLAFLIIVHDKYSSTDQDGQKGTKPL